MKGRYEEIDNKMRNYAQAIRKQDSQQQRQDRGENGIKKQEEKRVRMEKKQNREEINKLANREKQKQDDEWTRIKRKVMQDVSKKKQ